MSSVFLAIGPETDIESKGELPGPVGTVPGDGLNPTTEQKLPGILKLPPVSLPEASHTSPLTKDEAAPPDEPPTVFLVFHGLNEAPNTSLKVFAPAPNSGVFDFPTTIPPFFSNLCTKISDFVGI